MGDPEERRLTHGALLRTLFVLALLVFVILGRGHQRAWELSLLSVAIGGAAWLLFAKDRAHRDRAALFVAAALLVRTAAYVRFPAATSARFSVVVVAATLLGLIVALAPFAGGDEQRRAPAPVLVRILLLALILTVGFLAGELSSDRILRSELHAIRPLEGAAHVHVKDPELGHAYAPDFVGTFLHPEYGGERFATNSVGFRDEEWPTAEQRASERGVVRIALLGDSMTVGLGVERSGTIAKGLEARLDAATPTALRVHSLAVPGYGARHHRIVLERFGPRLRPDVVVLLFYDGNDLDDVLDHAEYERSVQDPGGGAGPARTVPPLYAEEYWTRWSPFYLELRSRLGPRLGLAPPPPYGAFLLRSMHRSPDPEVRAALALTDEALRAIEATCGAWGGQLVVARIPSLLQAEPAALERVLVAEGLTPEEVDPGLPGSAVLAACAERGVPVLDLLPALERDGPGRNPHFWYEGHPREKGNTAMAEALAAFLLERVEFE